MPTTYTPLRYPGGKSSLYPIVMQVISENSLTVSTYIEPFAGGAGIAMKMLLRDEIGSVVLNDLDPAIASFWRAIASCPKELISFVDEVDVSLEEWTVQRERYNRLRRKALDGFSASNCDKTTTAGPIGPLDFLSENESFELACSSLFLNRTNRSGIMSGGPIGGQQQEGYYKIDARFNKDGLIRKIEAISKRSDSIIVHNLDAVDFFKDVIETIPEAEKASVLAYFDPPYVAKGPGLYENSLTTSDHENISRMIHGCGLNWILTYDNEPLVDRLYGDLNPSEISINYCAYKSKQGKEVLVLSPSLTLGSN